MMRSGLIGMLLLSAIAVGAERVVPVRLAPGQYEARHQARVTVESDGASCVVRSDTGEWDAGVRLNPPSGRKFDFSGGRFLAVEVENLSADRQLRLTMHVSSGERGQRSASHVELPLSEVNTGIGLNPGERRTMRLYLPHRRLFAAPEGGKNIRFLLDTDRINGIEFKMQWVFEAHQRKDLMHFRLSGLRLEGEPDVARQVPSDYFPFIDEYGQYRHLDWPEKVHADSQLRERLVSEREENVRAGSPAEWDEFGGWAAGPQLQATGSFRVERVDGKWYFVTPSGHLFWSFGIDVLQTSSDAVDGRRHPEWFAGAMPADGRYDFNRMNLRRKYGRDDFEQEFFVDLQRRLRAWGVNTIGNWATAAFVETRKVPYVLSLGEVSSLKRLGVPTLTATRFYDVFSPAFEETMGRVLARCAAERPVVAASLTDPLCIGYFIDNELRFGSLAQKVLEEPRGTATRAEFLRRVRTQYGADIAALNRAWETQYADWAALEASSTTPAGRGFRRDASSFEAAMVRRYFEVCRRGVKSSAPERLYLGSRFIGFRQPGFVWQAAREHCDVVTVNTYSNSVNNVNDADFGGRPVLVGEFHFGTLDRGMFSAGLAPVVDQRERAMSLTRFVQGALAHPSFVGAHWFQFRDQPLTGRFDGEGYQIGFVDVADTPYREMTSAARAIGEHMYRYRQAGRLTDWQ